MEKITRRLFLRNTAAAGAVGATVAPVIAEPVRTPREQAIWHIKELERLALEDGAREAMVTVTGRFYTPRFHCKTLMFCPFKGSIDDFGDADFLAAKGGAS